MALKMLPKPFLVSYLSDYIKMKEKMESRGSYCSDLDQEEKAMVYLSTPI